MIFQAKKKSKQDNNTLKDNEKDLTAAAENVGQIMTKCKTLTAYSKFASQPWEVEKDLVSMQN